MSKTDNLRPVRTEAEAKEKGRNGGIASGVSRRNKRILTDALIEELTRKGKDGKTVAENITKAVIATALTGDVRAYKTIVERVEGMPVQGSEEGAVDNLAERLRDALSRVCSS